ncbi:4-hydroxythreonine-4-phosphate dehydrogenase PdxA [Tepidamorphus sp. 3E244]|uniref:4-hydroxythreonine-4-phosphate dehydrogenase PdxA n=1 Tax=Tepidamorphus sp. 3E244 TaxID=3385498 RepID=UPI0038FC905C
MTAGDGSLPLALTIGEPAGIGPELAAMAFLRREELGLPPFVLIGGGEIVAERARACRLGELELVRVEAGSLSAAASLFQTSFPVLELASPSGPSIAGKTDTAQAGLVTGSIEAAVRLTLAGELSGVVTNPICKETLYAAGFRYPGHTEYLGALASDHLGHAVHPVMMLAGADLRVVPVTVHIPLNAVPDALSTDLIVETVEIVVRDLRSRFGVDAPRIAVAGLNPHAGEGGTIGREDVETVAPAIAQLQAKGFDVRGPLPADTMFHARARSGYDAAVCMYHDQALIPIKTIAFDTGVNVTLGLPFVRTSPDHGTAFDIAGTGKANVASLAEALKMAARLATNQRIPAGASA